MHLFCSGMMNREKSSTQGKMSEAETRKTRSRYDRISPVYDLFESLAERSKFSRWRRLLFEQIKGPTILEVGVGTGKNFPYYPPGLEVTAIDLSEGMLSRARKKLANYPSARINLRIMDVQKLDLEEGSFDTAVATFVFCSVPDPVLGLREVRRVLKPEGKLLLLEHVLSERPVLRFLMKLMSPITVRITGANINRVTVRNIQKAGFRIEEEKNLWLDIVKLIVARPEQ
ncbi:phosphatidylethanolamine/phosphatidyl-N-methylethanolamine N-methyltransferase [Candidatus Hakubella thermalkaliphila]|uniref:Phosphatidylethanolamine/phosphatidyl-N-methylethanolamine N-methyltransferase n=2 Tax=Candidatus Hakubella thermalkaliphila TaxID=2754717 RepID=A0A6V8PV14_9ACTN|nr:phosphatidylethanolamine/phosphatidyl-N-methylethanolamine N-methyltransferase [Candidatus Hakubella thermalkaliphila]GFP26591.1 phosphatidylethanolamine/phosphatidyl-N-methylethanolamine N-methyltransferase [Candidatus Hakubella thermalkaliphila]GFP34591.1 phosphatidylethanolamine/phosphatidyl-N-methylethanolamine N-methyltransferase [Candidatus Hakubella thermalkaliphila]